MLPDTDLRKLSLEDRCRLAYYLEHNLINAISPLAACLDGNTAEEKLVECARHAKKRIVGLVNEVRTLAGLRPNADRLLAFRDLAAEQRQLYLPLPPALAKHDGDRSEP